CTRVAQGWLRRAESRTAAGGAVRAVLHSKPWRKPERPSGEVEEIARILRFDGCRPASRKECPPRVGLAWRCRWLERLARGMRGHRCLPALPVSAEEKAMTPCCLPRPPASQG